MEPTVDRPTAIVTGAAQGIGRAIAARLARDGMDVVIADLNADRLDVVAREVRALGRHALPLAVDVTDAADRERLFARTLETFGRLDALVNNAGIQRIAAPLAVTEEHWDAVMGVNAKATYFCCQLALRHMVAAWRGRIVNVASIAGKMAGGRCLASGLGRGRRGGSTCRFHVLSGLWTGDAAPWLRQDHQHHLAAGVPGGYHDPRLHREQARRGGPDPGVMRLRN